MYLEIVLLPFFVDLGIVEKMSRGDPPSSAGSLICLYHALRTFLIIIYIKQVIYIKQDAPLKPESKC